MRERTIWKYELKVTDHQVIKIPINFKILSCKVHHGELCLWCLIHPDNIVGEMIIDIYGTGHPLPRRNLGTHIDTVIDGAKVWHVFRVI